MAAKSTKKERPHGESNPDFHSGWAKRAFLLWKWLSLNIVDTPYLVPFCYRYGKRLSKMTQRFLFCPLPGVGWKLARMLN